MKKQRSFGIFPLRWQEGQWQVLLVQHASGHWAFPKGRAEEGESPSQTAERELTEETGLYVQAYLSDEPYIEKYSFLSRGERIHKLVAYWIAIVTGDIVLQAAEIRDSCWVDLPEAINRLTFPEGRALCRQVNEWLQLQLPGNVEH